MIDTEAGILRLPEVRLKRLQKTITSWKEGIMHKEGVAVHHWPAPACVLRDQTKEVVFSKNDQSFQINQRDGPSNKAEQRIQV